MNEEKKDFRWMIHLKDGRTIKDEYVYDIPEDEITSLERVVNGKIYTIKKSPSLTNFFVKTTESKDIRMTPGGVQPFPAVVHERIVGAFIKPSNEPLRVEMAIDPKTGNVKLSCFKVKKVTKDGFD